MGKPAILVGGSRGLLGKKYAKLLEKKRGAVAAEYRKTLGKIFTDLVKGTPQWSGNLASNWYIYVPGSMDAEASKVPRYRRVPIRVGGYVPWEIIPQVVGRLKRGDDPAVSSTLARELPKLDVVRYNSRVILVNKTPYASQVQAGEGPDGRSIRPQNLDAAGKVMMVAHVKLKYQMKGINLV